MKHGMGMAGNGHGTECMHLQLMGKLLFYQCTFLQVYMLYPWRWLKSVWHMICSLCSGECTLLC